MIFQMFKLSNRFFNLLGSIHSWGTKKGKKDLRTFFNYLLQITFI